MRNIEHFRHLPEPEEENISNNPEIAYFTLMGLYEKYKTNDRSLVKLSDQTIVVFRKDLPPKKDPQEPIRFTAQVNTPTEITAKGQAAQWACAASITLTPDGATALSLPADALFVEGKPIEEVQSSGSAGYGEVSILEAGVPMVDWITRILIKNEYIPPPRFSFPHPEREVTSSQE